MHVTSSNFTVAEYCDQMKIHTIRVNRDYQRSDEVWPLSARSYLIDTILHGLPVPKFALSQKTDLKSRKTIKEIVDGQQRSRAIFDFYEDKFRITGRSDWSGLKYSELGEESQQKFVTYAISTDIFSGATDEEIRQVFRRMNSYTVPLNHQEKRHATFQGKVKWFIVEMTEKYSTGLKSMGVFTEKQLGRMQDAQLLTEIMMGMLSGIETYSQNKINAFYDSKDVAFPEEGEIRKRFEDIFSILFGWQDLHDGNLMRSSQIYSLSLAITHCLKPIQPLNLLVKSSGRRSFNDETVIHQLSELSESLEADPCPHRFQEFVKASREGTNTITTRQARFRYYCDALQT